ncbi:MAG: carboxypeptidase-like regulatory domain-containing protein, partial [Bacteroidota bacterium]|nr:carboxypeptidase-like regulatory domain-containing protein [Bacteroidota bacterium]
MKSCLKKFFGDLREGKQKKPQFLLSQKVFFIFLFVSISFAGIAQNTTITGTVTDTTGSPIQGVTVTADHSKKAVISKEGGSFSIQVTPADKKLTFSFVGMSPLTQPLNGQTSFNI